MTWQGLAEWWSLELAGDPAYEEEVTPLVIDLVGDLQDRLVLDVGCGDGRLMSVFRSRGTRMVVGVDIERPLLASASRWGPVVRALLPNLGFLAPSLFDVIVVCLVLEHVEEDGVFFDEVARLIRPGGVLVVVMNHPFFTAPGSAPIEDDDEVLWRAGEYLSPGYTDEPAGTETVRFHHRPFADLLTHASHAGWDLDLLVERGPGSAQIDRHPPLGRQRNIPRLLGARWRRRM